jgi:hypothetical protein
MFKKLTVFMDTDVRRLAETTKFVTSPALRTALALPSEVIRLCQDILADITYAGPLVRSCFSSTATLLLGRAVVRAHRIEVVIKSRSFMTKDALRVEMKFFYARKKTPFYEFEATVLPSGEINPGSVVFVNLESP